MDHLLKQTARKTNVVLLIFPALEAVCIEQFTTSSPVLLRIFPIVQIVQAFFNILVWVYPHHRKVLRFIQSLPGYLLP